MVNLMKLEMRRVNIRNVWISFLSINAGIIGILLLFEIDPEITKEFYTSYDDVFFFLELMVAAAFVIYASVLLSQLIVEEFRDKTVSVLFMYPVNRKKLLFAKLMVVSMLTFLFIVSSGIIVFTGFYWINQINSYILEPLSSQFLREKIIHLIVMAIACAGMSLIPLAFGMIKYSVQATITSSILIIAILSSSVGNGTNLFSFIGVPIFLGMIGFMIAAMVISKSVRKDF